jgi:hypothetical protein
MSDAAHCHWLSTIAPRHSFNPDYMVQAACRSDVPLRRKLSPISYDAFQNDEQGDASRSASSGHQNRPPVLAGHLIKVRLHLVLIARDDLELRFLWYLIDSPSCVRNMFAS